MHLFYVSPHPTDRYCLLNLKHASSAVNSEKIFTEMAECMKRLDDALYSTILLHSDSDGENSETETLHTAVPTISSNGDVTDGGIDAIDREQWITMDDNMVRARNAFTCDLRSKEESRAVMKVCTHKFMSTVIAEVRLRDFTSHQFYDAL